jgi:hypothetical protein
MRVICYIIIISGIEIAYSQTYNSQAAIDYADYWWDGRNTMNGVKSQASYNLIWGTPYDNYTTLGGDCANFVSQCLIAGGLDLSTGTDGNGSGVKSDGCITGVSEIVTHLKRRPDVENYDTKNAVNSNDVFSKTDAGDPVFVGNAIDPYKHSLFCSAVNGNQNLYSTHSSDYHNEPYTNWNYPWAYYFHIKSSIPDHCSNCKLDGDETGIDCGGSCPPCQHAKNNVNYNYNTSSLPQTTRAFGTITAGNADVRVLPGQDVTFISSGEIILKPGFHAQSGSRFHAERKSMRKSVGADCEKYCIPFPHNFECRDRAPYSYGWELANITRCTVSIHQLCNGNMKTIYMSTINIGSDGYVPLWDLRTGIDNRFVCNKEVFWYTVILEHCNGNQDEYEEPIEGSITVYDCMKSLSTDTNLLSNEDVVLSDIPNDNDIQLFPNPNSGSFTIGNTDISKIQQIQVFNPIGQNVYSVENPDNNMINLPSGAKGTFFVKITTQTESVVKKIMVE